MRHIFAAVIFQIVERDGLSQSSGITLPRPEVAKDHVVSDAIPIRRVGEQTALVHRQGLRQTTIYADSELALHPTIRRIAAREEDNPLAIGRPGDHFVMNAHAVI